MLLCQCDPTYLKPGVYVLPFVIEGFQIAFYKGS